MISFISISSAKECVYAAIQLTRFNRIAAAGSAIANIYTRLVWQNRLSSALSETKVGAFLISKIDAFLDATKCEMEYTKSRTKGLNFRLSIDLVPAAISTLAAHACYTMSNSVLKGFVFGAHAAAMSIFLCHRIVYETSDSASYTLQQQTVELRNSKRKVEFASAGGLVVSGIALRVLGCPPIMSNAIAYTAAAGAALIAARIFTP